MGMNRDDFLILFRRAKTQDTLDLMLDAQLNKGRSVAECAYAILAHEKRELEIERGLFCRKLR